MKKHLNVAVLNFDGVVPTSVSGPRDMLADVALVSKALNVPSGKFFDVDVLNTSRKSPKTFNVIANGSINNGRKYDMIIIPAMKIDCIGETLQKEQGLIQWIKQQHSRDSEVVSICLGAFLLAATGLLDGRRATTHWIGASYFRQLFPKVQLEDEKVIVDEGSICTCGAAYSFTSLMIYLIEKHCGREMALAMSRVFMIEIHNASQNAFGIFNIQMRHSDANIRNAQIYIEKNLARRLAVSDLADRFNMSQRSFIRRFTTATGNKPLQYIQRVRVEYAKRMLEHDKVTIQEVALSAGYEDLASFRQVFKKVTGLTPAAYKNKYSRIFADAVVG